MFESGEEPEVTTGLGIMNELVVPCLPLLLVQDAERDLLAVEDMRNRWCSYLGQEMECESFGGGEVEGERETRPISAAERSGYGYISHAFAKDQYNQAAA